MSETITEIANREAEDAEFEPDEDGEPDVPPDDTPEPDEDGEPDEDTAPAAPAEPPSDVAAERALKQIDRAGDAYTRKVASIQRETPLGLVECPLCPIPGYVSEAGGGPPSPEQRLAVFTVLGEGLPTEYVPSPHLHKCETCDGQGFLATGSKRPGKADVDCHDCMGSGYIDARQQAALGVVTGPTTPGLPLPAPTPYADQPTGLHASQITQGGYSFTLVPGAAPDQHGRLAGHPLWGSPLDAGGL